MGVWRAHKPGVPPPQGREARSEESRESSAGVGPSSNRGEAVADIGKSITIRGDLSGDEDLVLDGRIEGRVELSDHHLTIGPNAHIQAELSAKEVTINGRVVGNVTATERVEIGASGRLDGDILAPRLLVQEGAQLNGSVSMKESSAVVSTKKSVEKPPPEKSAAKPSVPSPGSRPPEPQATL